MKRPYQSPAMESYPIWSGKLWVRRLANSTPAALLREIEALRSPFAGLRQECDVERGGIVRRERENH